MPLTSQELSQIQLARIERTEIKSLKAHQDEIDVAEEESLAGVKKRLAKLEKKQLELQRHVASDTSLESQIERMQETIVVTQTRIRVRASARTVVQLQENSRDHAPKVVKPKTLLEGVQDSIDYARSGKAKRAAFEDYERKKRKEKEAGQAASLNIKDEQLQDFRNAFSRFDADGSGSIDARELGSVMRMLGDNPTVVEVAALAHQMDASGEIEFGEFVEMMAVKKGYCAPGTTLSAADLAAVEEMDDEQAAAATQAKVEARARQAALAAATARDSQAAEAAAMESAEAAEIAAWAGGTIKALKPAPIYPDLIVEPKSLIVGNCRRNQEYLVLDAGHVDGWLRVHISNDVNTGWVSVHNNSGVAIIELVGEKKALLMAEEDAAAAAAAAAEAARLTPGPLKIFIHRPYADCADVRIDGLWPHNTVRELTLRVHHAMGLHPLSQQLSYDDAALHMADDTTTMSDLSIPQFGRVDSAHKGEEMLGAQDEGMLGVSAGWVGEAIDVRETMESAAANVGHRLAMLQLANDPMLKGMVMPPNPRMGRGGHGYGGGGGGRRGGGGRGAR